jgi:hypothetical protein
MLSARLEKIGFERAVARWKKKSGERCKDIITEATEFAIRSASKHTAPAAGRANIPASAYKRKITVLHGTDGRKNRYKVPFKNAQKKGRKFFKSLKEARDFAKIKFRGMARASWFMSLRKIGKNLSSDQQAILNKAPQLANKAFNRISIRNGICGRSITITNKADGIGKHSYSSVAEGLRSAKNRINWLLKDLKKRIKK